MEPEEEPCGAAVREVFEEVNKPKNSMVTTCVLLPSKVFMAHRRERGQSDRQCQATAP